MCAMGFFSYHKAQTLQYEAVYPQGQGNGASQVHI